MCDEINKPKQQLEIKRGTLFVINTQMAHGLFLVCHLRVIFYILSVCKMCCSKKKRLMTNEMYGDNM